MHGWVHLILTATSWGYFDLHFINKDQSHIADSNVVHGRKFGQEAHILNTMPSYSGILHTVEPWILYTQVQHNIKILEQ